MVYRIIRKDRFDIVSIQHFGKILSSSFPPHISEALSKPELQIPPEIIQLLLHLQNVRESNNPSDSFLHIETMVAKVVCPYLGTRGLYLGGETPAVPSQQLEAQPKSYARRHLGRTFHGRDLSPLYRPLYHPP